MLKPRTRKQLEKAGVLLFACGLIAFGVVIGVQGFKGIFDFTQQPQTLTYDEFVRNGSTSNRVILSDFDVDPSLAVKGYWSERTGSRSYYEYFSGYFQPLLRTEGDVGPVRAMVLIESSRYLHGKRDPEFKNRAMGYGGTVGFGPTIRARVAFKSLREEVGDDFRRLAPARFRGKPIELASDFELLTARDDGSGISLLFGILFSVVALIAIVFGVGLIWFVQWFGKWW